MRVAVVGLGYVGLVTSACLARWGNEVTGIEADPKKLARLLAGTIPLHEPGLAELAQEGIGSGLLRFSSSSDQAEVLATAELVILAVGTHDGNGGWQTETIRRTLAQIGPLLGDDSTLAIRSTLPPEFVDQVPELFERIRADAGRPSIPVLLNPEFTREAHAVHDFMSPSRVVIGIGSDADGRGAAVMRRLYGHLDAPILVMPAIDASFAKLGSNLFLATKISFANELATLCDAYGATIDHVMGALALDGRIGGSFLGAGVGFGGSCLPHQVKMTVKTARQANIPVSLLAAVDAINYGQRAKVAGLLGDLLPGGLSGARVALLGLTFKPDTDDLRDAPSITIADLLIERGATVVAYDPMEAARRSWLQVTRRSASWTPPTQLSTGQTRWSSSPNGASSRHWHGPTCDNGCAATSSWTGGMHWIRQPSSTLACDTRRSGVACRSPSRSRSKWQRGPIGHRSWPKWWPDAPRVHHTGPDHPRRGRRHRPLGTPR